MDSASYSTTFTVEQTPEEAFAAINDVRGWWTGEIEGPTDRLGAAFTYRYGDVHRSTQQITEFVPGRRVAWHVVDGYLSFADDKDEWTDTDITFDITPEGDRTQILFTHVGLRPEIECFDSCSGAWGYYVNTSLRNLIASTPGHPHD